MTAPLMAWRRAKVSVLDLSPFRQRLFLALVAVLPLHTVFLAAWISWKPLLVVLAVIAAHDLVTERRWPWHLQVSMALGLFLALVWLGWPAPEHRERFIRLFLALVVGGLVMLVTERSLRHPGMLDRALRVVVRVGALMAVTAVVFELAVVGAFGRTALDSINDVPGVFRVAKDAYLVSGFVALTNWHQDPGYGAAWASLWSVLTLVASARGQGFRRPWADGAVIGGLWFWVVMAMSRTGWLAAPIALGFASVLLVRRRLLTARQVFGRLAVALVVLIVLMTLMFLVDVPFVGGDLDLQFAFRLSQGFDMLASITGLFEGSERFTDRFVLSEERADVWPEYIAMFRANPWLGVGLSVGWQTNSIRQEPHNLLIELLAETGIVGLAGFLVVVVVILRHGGGLVGTVALVAAFLHAMTQTVLFEPTWWFAAGLWISGKGLAEADALT